MPTVRCRVRWRTTANDDHARIPPSQGQTDGNGRRGRCSCPEHHRLRDGRFVQHVFLRRGRIYWQMSRDELLEAVRDALSDVKHKDRCCSKALRANTNSAESFDDKTVD
ncbi:MAG TPA: hypothetical protein VMR43_17575 [Variovorax sp.]|nr:hypothetical protein [Variovorax sp.]